MSGQKILFVDRDGVLFEEPADEQIDSFEKFKLVADVIPALRQIKAAGFDLVMVTNQDGLGTESFPRTHFDGPQQLLLQILQSQGIEFREVLIDESFPHENKDTRKPGIGMVLHYLRDRAIDLDGSAMVGDRDTDMQFAEKLGVRGFHIGKQGLDWLGIAHALCSSPRQARVERKTKETSIRVELDLDRPADPQISTGLGFFDHMLEQIGKHSGISFKLECIGDLHIDDHHTIEDCALAFGAALKQAIGDKRGIARYGFTLPMDDTLAAAALDFSGRPYLVFEGQFPRAEVGGMATELVEHFFRSVCDASGINLNLSVRGDNAHHMVEASFKVFARALGQAVRREGNALPTTKGLL